MKSFGFYYIYFVSLLSIIISAVYVEQLVRVLFFLQFLFIFYHYVKKKCWKVKNNIVEKLYLLMVVFGVFIGLINVVFGHNDILNYIIYSVIYLSGFFALKLGNYFSKFESNRDIYHAITNISIGYIMLFIPRCFFIGLDIRTSMGFSFINSLVIFHKKTTIAFCFSLISITVLFLSGLRSVLILGVFSFVFTLFNVNFLSRNILKILLFSCVFFSFALMFIPKNNYIYSSIEKSYHIVSVRMQQTFLNEEVKVDPNGGRLDEANDALEYFFDRASILDIIIGKGFGFSFQDRIKGQNNTAHTHITPVAYFVRNGIYGLFFYIYISYKVLLLVIVSSIMAWKTDKFLVLLYVSSFLWVFSSLFAGFLIDPVSWLIIGLSLGLSKKKREGKIK